MNALTTTANQPPAPIPQSRACEICGAPITPDSRHQWSRYCSGRCRMRASRQKRRGCISAAPTVYWLDPASILVRPDVFQFKQGTNASGVGADLAAATMWDERLAGTMILYHVGRPDNSDGLPAGNYALNAHHRRDLALRASNRPAKVPCQFVDNGADPAIQPMRDTAGNPMREIPAREARKFGALMNLAEGRGTIFDMAKFIRDSGMIALPDSISTSEAKVSAATGLAALSPYLWDEMRRGNLTEPIAATIGRELGGREQEQNDLYKQIDGQKLTAQEIADQIRLAKGAQTFEQENLFGLKVLTASTIPQQAAIIGYLRSEWNDAARGMTGAAKRKRMLETAGDTRIDAKEMQARALEARQSLELLETFCYSSGTATNDIVGTLARFLANNDTAANRAHIYEEARIAVATALAEDAGGIL